MTTRKDDWEKTRGTQGHLTTEEIALVRKYFMDNRSTESVARELKCATRTIQKYFSQFQGCPPAARAVRVRESRAGQDTKPAPAPPAKELPSRFYKSTFEL